MEFTLQEAIMYYQHQKLDNWVQECLRAETGDMPNPNFALADGLLLENRSYFCPLRIPLDELKTVRIENDIVDKSELDHFNYKVGKILDKLPNWDMPPLIAQFDGKDFALTDGNHRYSALNRAGFTSYYTIVWCNSDMEDAVRKVLTDRGWI